MLPTWSEPDEPSGAGALGSELGPGVAPGELPSCFTMQAMRWPAASNASGTATPFGVLDSLERQLGVEAMQVTNVTGDDDRALASGDEDDRGINDVRCAGTPAQNPCRLREHLVERRHDRRRSLHERAEWRPPRVTAPSLPEDARRDDQSRAALQRLANERTHPRVAPLERDEGASV